jgi:light-harvesting complex 1 beta chain
MTDSTYRDSNEVPNDNYQSYWTIFGLLFILFGAIALTGQLLFLNWRNWLPGAEGSQSIFEGVRASVDNIISQLC